LIIYKAVCDQKLISAIYRERKSKILVDAFWCLARIRRK